MENIERKVTLASELKIDDVRCVLKNVSKEGKITYIKIFNIKDERRSEVLSELEEIVGDNSEIEDMDMFNLFYLSLITEFTDLIIDTEDLKFLLNSGNLTSRQLMQEMNDMIYELQYEKAMTSLNNVRNLGLGLIAQSTIEEMQYTQERLDKVKNKRKENKKVTKKRPRHFIK